MARGRIYRMARRRIYRFILFMFCFFCSCFVFFVHVFLFMFCFFVHLFVFCSCFVLVHARSYAASHGVRVRFYRDPHVLSSGLPFGDILVDSCNFYKSAHAASVDFYRNTHRNVRGNGVTFYKSHLGLDRFTRSFTKNKHL